MLDPDEGVAADGSIVTGVARERVPAVFEPVVAAAVEEVVAACPGAGLHLYGSVATGRARAGASDVDLVGVGLPEVEAARIGAVLSARFAATCRGVEIGPVQPLDLAGDSDEAHGNRVFLRHYCVRLAGPPAVGPAAYPADVRAARGFNGDIGAHAQRWRRAVPDADPAPLARRVARKSLVAAAGLVSVHDGTWTTDRARGARRWAEIDPTVAGGMAVLLEWAEGSADASRADLRDVLDDCVAPLVAAFAERIGLWG